MSATAAATLPRAIIAISGIYAAACVAAIAWQALANPMAARERALEARLTDLGASAPAVTDDLPQPDEAPLKQLRTEITEKAALWKPLVAAPVSAPKPEARPDLKERLKGVSVTRQQIQRGDVTLVKVMAGPADKLGSWKKVGDKINGLTIREIKPEVVVFGLEQNGKEFTVELPRR